LSKISLIFSEISIIINNQNGFAFHNKNPFKECFSDFAVILRGHTALIFADLDSIGEQELQLF